MKGLLFLGLVGAAIYVALVLSYDVLSRDAAKDAFVRQSLIMTWLNMPRRSREAVASVVTVAGS